MDVVLGLQSPHRKTVQELVDQRPNTTLHGTLPSLAGLIARADLSIGAGCAWERACLGLPSLVVAVASNQLSFSVALDQAGHCQLLGDAANVTVDHIYAAILARMNNPLLDQSPYALTDGWGAQRLCIAMLGIQGKLTFRIAKEFDEALLWRLSSGIGAGPNRSLKNSSHDDNQHFSVKKKFADSSRRIFIAETTDGCPIGQIHIYKHPLGNTASTTGSKIDYLLDKCAGDAGLESELVTYSFRALEQCWRPSFGMAGEVLPNNLIDSICFARIGFTVDSKYTSQNLIPICPAQSLSPSRITILSDSSSWLNAVLPEFIGELWQRDHSVRWIHHPSDLVVGDVCFMLSCGRLLTRNSCPCIAITWWCMRVICLKGRVGVRCPGKFSKGRAKSQLPCLKLLLTLIPGRFICSSR